MAVESVPIAYSEASPLYCAIVPSNLPSRIGRGCSSVCHAGQSGPL